MNRFFLIIPFFTVFAFTYGQSNGVDSMTRLTVDDVIITIDLPLLSNKNKTILILYALPNGNNTEQTRGRKTNNENEWRYDIQHIEAQTRFIRNEMKSANIIVAYLENKFLSWPAWKAAHVNYKDKVLAIVDTLRGLDGARDADVYLNGHSGGGRFIFSLLDAYTEIPRFIKRISFIDSNYGYDSSYLQKLQTWLASSSNYLNVFAYNDSVALYNDKPVVSAKGGTWYRTQQMINDLSSSYHLKMIRNDSIQVLSTMDDRLSFLLKSNPDRKIYHTQQVELNGFIHSVLIGTKYASKNYQYYGRRAYRTERERD
ncbi:MAG: hypothetical protein H7Y31_17210 [Chitinophagaceae bacterium]|nr:hypothetical protein [Chitinophagaceae bacterium]